MNTLRTAFILALALALSGCFQTRTLVRLNADGSGTVEETMLFNSAIQVAMQAGMGMVSGMEEQGDTPYKMEDLLARAEDLGATFVSVEEQDLLFGDGYIATYAFEDINTLRVTSDPSTFLPEELREDMMNDLGDGEEEPIAFAYRDGELLISMPDPDLGGNGEEMEEQIIEENEIDFYDAPRRDPKKQPAPIMEVQEPEQGFGGDEAEGMMAMLFRDMRFSLAVELPSEAVETNASFVEGRMLTLYDMDFETLLESPGSFERLQQLSPDGPPNSATAMRLLGELPGIQYEPEMNVTVTFR
ncbi:MAG: hypothetical protein AAGI52_11850 [Bacteroidota bacterium]